MRATTILYDCRFKLMDSSPKIYTELLEISTKVYSEPQWNSFEEKKIESIRRNGRSSAYFSACKDEELYGRPPGTGVHCQFLRIEGIMFADKNWKSERFDFAQLTNCCFFSCDLSRTTFIGTQFTSCIFSRCRFRGEEISFYKATAKELIFIDCSFEYTNMWVETKDPKEIRKILTDRLLDAECRVVIR